MIPVGLRIDVDTLRGTRQGVPNLLELLARHEIKATFFFSVGPDNMGRHLWRLLRLAFLLKMLRTRAASLYGWDILLRGTLWPGPMIGQRCAQIIARTAAAGHEIGLHAWDHHRWQSRIDHLDRTALRHDIKLGYDQLTRILKRPPTCFAAPAWRVTPAALEAISQFPWNFTSDCRGDSIFRPRLEKVEDPQKQVPVQIPTTLPTYDELVGHQCTEADYNNYLLGLIKPDQLNVLTIHAEVEGICCAAMFEEFLTQSRQQKIVWQPLGSLMSGLKETTKLKEADIKQHTQPGREGWIAVQEGTV